MKNKKITSILVSFLMMMSTTLSCADKVQADDSFALSVTNVEGENYNKLNWTDLGKGYTYRVYQKGEDDPVYQTIPTKKSVKTLNIYPDKCDSKIIIPNTGLSGGQIDLDGKPVPNSGILKTWLSKENISDVSIDCISLSSFNSNPSKYLNKVDGKWNYDSVFYGMWNLDPEGVYLNNSAIEYLRNYINEGQGFMTSHHTIGFSGLDKGVNKLAKEMGVEIFTNTTELSRDSSGNKYNTVSFECLESGLNYCQSSYWPSGNKVKIVKNGLLINYPFKVGEIGDVIEIEPMHGLSVFGTGDVWMSVLDPEAHNCNKSRPFKEIVQSPSTEKKGTNNFYVHTYNNTAIINSGHSFPNITTAETRIIANTLYYLSQVTPSNSCDDHKGQDVTAPNRPDFKNIVLDKKNNKLNINLDKQDDIGTTYSYYIEGKDNAIGNIVKSDVKEVAVKSGFKGYSIVVDKEENTVPDTVVETTSTEYEVENTLGNDFYIHVAAVDNAGNVSEVSTYKYSRPVLELTPSTTEEVKDKVTIKAETSSSKKIEKIIIPDGKEVNSDSAEYDVDVNGTYTFTAVDVDGNETTESITINNIKPDIIINVEPNMNRTHLKENFIVDLTINHINSIFATEVRIKYDSSRLQFLGLNTVDGIELVNDDVEEGEITLVLASLGFENVLKDETLLKLNFTGIAAGDALIDVIKADVADGDFMEKTLRDAECGETTISIVDRELVSVDNKDKTFTLLDLSIIAKHYGDDPDALLLEGIDADLNLDGKIDKADYKKCYELMLKNPNRKF